MFIRLYDLSITTNPKCISSEGFFCQRPSVLVNPCFTIRSEITGFHDNDVVSYIQVPD